METIDDIRREESQYPTPRALPAFSPGTRFVLGIVAVLGLAIAVWGAIAFLAPLFIFGLALTVITGFFLLRRLRRMT